MSAETTFTPGPWSVPHFARPEVGCKCGYVLVEGYMGAVATVHFSEDRELRNGDNPPLEEAIANAHLIAAAPDLYAALEACAAEYRQMYVEKWAPAEDEFPDSLLRAEAALKKARTQ